MACDTTIIIAIDGPSAAGKGTLTKQLALKLDFDYLDTGLLYRKLAYNVIINNLNSSKDIINFIPQIDFKADTEAPLNTESISQMASKLAVQYNIREQLNTIQKNFKTLKKGIIVDGRDIGTTIFPNADCKFYINATPASRALRRFKQLQTEGNNIIFEQVYKDIIERDMRDENRKISPSLPANDAIIIDTSNLDAKDVLTIVYNKICEILKY